MILTWNIFSLFIIFLKIIFISIALFFIILHAYTIIFLNDPYKKKVQTIKR